MAKAKSKKKTKVDKLDLNVKKDYSEKSKIDEELLEIQKKLIALKG